MDIAKIRRSLQSGQDMFESEQTRSELKWCLQRARGKVGGLAIGEIAEIIKAVLGPAETEIFKSNF